MRFKRSSPGLTLVEALVAISLMGIVLIPMLFLSSAYFLTQLTRTRESIDATHGASTFLNRFLEEATLTQRILVGATGVGSSDQDAIYFAYYEPVAQRSYRIGYRLTTTSGKKYLERLEYNPTTQAWTAGSPYNHVRAFDVALPSTAEFKYCSDSSCGTALTGTNRKNAIVVQLTNTDGTGDGWTFTKGRQTFKLTQNMPIVLSTSLPAGRIMLSDQPREMYNINLTNIATVPAPSRINLNPVGELFNYIDTASGATGVLSTILPGTIANPGDAGVAVTSDGRVFFGQYSATGKLYTWKDNILSTLTGTLKNPGQSMLVGPDDRVYMGQMADWSDPCRIYSWKSNTGLSSLITGGSLTNWGQYSLALGSNGVLYGGSLDTGDHILAWNSSTGVTTSLTSSVGIGDKYGFNKPLVNPVTNGVYFGSDSGPGKYYYWNGTSLTQVVTAGAPQTSIGLMSSDVTPTGRVYIGSYNTSSHVYTWEPTSGRLSTITLGTGRLSQPGYKSMVASRYTDRVYFGTGNADFLYTYTPTTETLTAVLAGGTSDSVGKDSKIIVLNDDRVVFNRLNTGPPYPGYLYTWEPNSGRLSTIFPSTLNGLGDDWSIAADYNNSRVFVGQNYSTSSNFWVWDANTNVLSTILPSNVAMTTGANSAILVGADGRVYMGSNGANPIWTWKDNILSTLLPTPVTGAGSTTLISSLGTFMTGGVESMAVGSDGRFFVGSNATSNFWTWMPGNTIYNVIRYTNTGINTYQTLSLSVSGSHSFTSVWQDIRSDLYLLDSANKKLDRYIFSPSNKQYNYATSLPLDTWVTSTTVLAIDQASNGALLMDRANKRIYVYSNRMATSGTPTYYNMSALSTVPTSPTGFAVNGRTGDYLVLDSAVVSGYVRLFVIEDNGFTLKQIIKIPVNDTNLVSDVLTAESNFSIHYDDRRNILYLTAPTRNKTYALSLPDYL